MCFVTVVRLSSVVVVFFIFSAHRKIVWKTNKQIMSNKKWIWFRQLCVEIIFGCECVQMCTVRGKQNKREEKTCDESKHRRHQSSHSVAVIDSVSGTHDHVKFYDNLWPIDVFRQINTASFNCRPKLLCFVIQFSSCRTNNFFSRSLVCLRLWLCSFFCSGHFVTH